jgi:HK97 family phage prohead protease
VKKVFLAEIKSGTTSSRQLTYVISTKAPDRENDRVLGFDLSNYRKNPVVLFAHDYKSLPVGKAVSISQVGDSLISTVEFVPADISPVAQQCYQLAAQGFMRGASIGFRPISTPKANELGGYDFANVELLEWSLVPVPAHPDALRRSVKDATSAGGIKGDLSDQQVAALVVRLVEDAAVSRGANQQLTDTETAALVVRSVFGSGGLQSP